MVVLLDCVSKKLHPPEFKARHILPTSGKRSVSLWDVPEPEALREWLDELMETDCKSEVFEVQEQFCVGLFSDLAAARASDQFTATTRSTAAAAAAHFDRVDERFKVSEQASAALKVASDLSATAARNTRTAVNSVGNMAKTVSTKAMENEKVAITAQATAQAFRGIGDKLTTSFKGLGLSWPTVGSTAETGSPIAERQQAAGLQAGMASQCVTRPAQSAAVSTSEGSPSAVKLGATVESKPRLEETAAPPAPSAPTAMAQPPNVFSLGEEDDATSLTPGAQKEAETTALSDSKFMPS